MFGRSHLVRATDAWNRQDVDEAIRHADRHLKSRPGDVDAWTIVAGAYLKREDYRGLVRRAKGLPEVVAGDPYVAYTIALAHVKIGRPDGAATWLATARRDDEIRSRVDAEPAFEIVREQTTYLRAIDRSDITGFG